MAHEKSCHGLLLINKPAELGSFDVVRKIKKILNTADVGHGGTLDRFATGVLPVFVGDGLKLARVLLENSGPGPSQWKGYEATIKLGVETDTLDLTGAVIRQIPLPPVGAAAVFEGICYKYTNLTPYWQQPPAFCAKKTGGARASDLVRQGETPELKPAAITIKAMDLKPVTADTLHMNVVCSKGTYIRALARDIAADLGTCGHLLSLNRFQNGPFHLDECVSLDDDLANAMIPVPTAASRMLTCLYLSGTHCRMIQQGLGQRLWPLLADHPIVATLEPQQQAAVFNDETGDLVALIQKNPDVSTAGAFKTLRCWVKEHRLN
jgi:tRNA pseudouridine55 synthase